MFILRLFPPMSIYFLLIATFKFSKGSFTVLTPFHETRCPTRFDVDCSDRFYFPFHPNITTDIKEDKRIGTFVGLNKILSVFEKSNFLVILTDFRGVEFAPVTYPVILRKVQLAWKWSLSTHQNLLRPHRVIYVQDEILRVKINLTNLHTFDFSLYWTTVGLSSSMHPFLNVSSYWKNTIPWNNLVAINLFPHVQYHNLFPTNDLLEYTIPIQTKYIFPTQLSPIKILILHPTEKYTMEQLSKLVESTGKALIEKYAYISHERFYLVNTTFSLPNMQTSQDLQVHIEKLSLAQICRRNFDIYLNLVYLAPTTWSALSDISELSSVHSSALCNPPSLNNVGFYFDFKPDFEVITSLQETLKTCNEIPEKVKSSGNAYTSHISKGYGNVWLSIMGNFSYITHLDGWQCNNGKLVKMIENHWYSRFAYASDVQLEIKKTFVQPEKGTTLYPVVIRSVNDDLKLVICGHQGFKQLSFVELLNVFDEYIWSLIVTLVFVASLLFNQIPNTAEHLTITQSVFVPLKIFLEQGDPFPKSLIRNPRCKYIIGTILLMGIVLSNAYKNTNVYNMIAQRKPLMYQYLKELVRDNFTIRSRSVEVGTGISHIEWWLRKNTAPVTLVDSAVGSHQRVFMLHLKDQPGSFEYFIKNSEVLVSSKNARRDDFPQLNNNLNNLLLNVSSVLPVTMSFLQDAVNRFELHKEMTEEEYDSQFLMLELDYLLDSFKTCERVALVLPSDLGYKYVKSLEKEGFGIVYQGVETYYEVNIAFVLKGFVPQYLVQRIKYAEWCGLWKRWQNLFQKKFLQKSEQSRERLTKPGMDGNVVVLFVLLGAGLVLSVLCFGMEFCLANKYSTLA